MFRYCRRICNALPEKALLNDSNVLHMYQTHKAVVKPQVEEVASRVAGKSTYSIVWKLGKDVISAQGVGQNKDESMRIASRELMSAYFAKFGPHQVAMLWVVKYMARSLARQLGAEGTRKAKQSGQSHQVTLDYGLAHFQWKCTGIGGNAEEADHDAFSQLYDLLVKDYEAVMAHQQKSQTDGMTKYEVKADKKKREELERIVEEQSKEMPELDSADILTKHQHAVDRRAGKPGHLDATFSVIPHPMGFIATLNWKITETGKPQSLVTKVGIGKSKAQARAQAALQMLEEMKIVPVISAETRARADACITSLKDGDLDEAFRIGMSLISTGDSSSVELFLIGRESMKQGLWQGLLANSATDKIGELVDTLVDVQPPISSRVWEELLDDCTTVSDEAVGRHALSHLLKLVDVFEDKRWSHMRGMLALERQSSVHNAFELAKSTKLQQHDGEIGYFVLPIMKASMSTLTELPLQGSLAVLRFPDGTQSVTEVGTTTRKRNGLSECTFKFSKCEQSTSLVKQVDANHVKIVFLEDVEVSYSRACAALRALYNLGSKSFLEGVSYRFSDEARSILLDQGDSTPSTSDKVNMGQDWELTPAQAEAVGSAMKNAITLIQGPPGTGKTYTACAIVDAWKRSIDREEKILLVADSNAATDNLRNALLKHGIRSLRFGGGKDSKSVLDLQEDCIREVEGTPLYSRWLELRERYKSGVSILPPELFTTRKAIETRALQNSRVVIATCVGAGHPDLNDYHFSRVLIDECTQAIEPISLIPLGRSCSKFVLMGDHKQLPPTVLSMEASLRGLSASLFERLVKKGTHPTFMLDMQRRMHPSIADFPNIHFYNGKVASNVGDRPVIPGFPWPTEDCRVALVKTATLAEQRSDRSKHNLTEANIVVGIVDKLIRAGNKPGEIGIIVPYSAQRIAVQRALASRGIEDKQIMVNTVDSFQGQEKEVIVFSAVRSNNEGEVGFLDDPRRMNVMLTRARRGLIVVADAETLTRKNMHWRDWVQWVEDRGSVLSPDDL